MVREELRKNQKMKDKKETKNHKKRNIMNDEVVNTTTEENKKVMEKKRKRKEKGNDVDISKHSQISFKVNSNKKSKEKKDKWRKNRKSKDRNIVPTDDQLGSDIKDGLHEQEDNGVQNQRGLAGTENSEEADSGKQIKSCKPKKAKKKKKKKDHGSSKEDEKLPEKTTEAEDNDVYHISSGDEDCSRGMKKWVNGYYESRLGLKVLQERIDDFITAYEEQLEQERKESEAKAAEGGWTVVVHHKGRKKTTDSDTGVAVGSVAQAALEDKVAKKKQKEVVAQDFYRFQKREAHRNEIMMLQSKFEQDRKRIQQHRAARKFKPY